MHFDRGGRGLRHGLFLCDCYLGGDWHDHAPEPTDRLDGLSRRGICGYWIDRMARRKHHRKVIRRGTKVTRLPRGRPMAYAIKGKTVLTPMSLNDDYHVWIEAFTTFEFPDRIPSLGAALRLR